LFIDLEEKHKKFEERMKERDREFQKKMMKMMMNRFTPSNTAQYHLY